MRNTTIIELNHDQAHEIIENPTVFITQIDRQLSDNEFEGKDILGGKVICMFHRNDSPMQRAWLRFLMKVKNYLNE